MNDFNYKKSLGQNFLQDKNILENIVKCANITDNALTIEIGPGSGNLTKEIAKVSKQVLCYEIDERLEMVLDDSLKEYHNINIIFADFLKRNINLDISKYEYDNLYLVANLPYYITTPIIEKIIATNLLFKKIVIMIRGEAVIDGYISDIKEQYRKKNILIKLCFKIVLFILHNNAV